MAARSGRPAQRRLSQRPMEAGAVGVSLSRHAGRRRLAGSLPVRASRCCRFGAVHKEKRRIAAQVGLAKGKAQAAIGHFCCQLAAGARNNPRCHLALAAGRARRRRDTQAREGPGIGRELADSGSERRAGRPLIVITLPLSSFRSQHLAGHDPDPSRRRRRRRGEPQTDTIGASIDHRPDR